MAVGRGRVRGRSRTRAGLLVGIMAAVLALPVSAGVARAADDATIVGAWQATIVADGEAVPASILFTADGGVIVISPEGLQGAAVGSWVRSGDGYLVTVIAPLLDDDGIVVLDQVATIAADGTLTSTGTATLAEGDASDPETETFTATATRITVNRPDAPAVPAPKVITAAGATPDAIRGAVTEYKALFGEDNGGEPGSFGSGHRTITWDKVPDDQSAPNTYEPDFFNGPAAPLARGAVFAAPAGTLMVSAAKGSPSGVPPRFGNINIQYATTFKAFSPEKLFSPVGTNIADLEFFVPGTDTPAVVRGFGAVYLDVDTDHTAFEFFDIEDRSLGTFATPIADGGLSFLGVAFPESIVHRVRITYGTAPLGADDAPDNDVAVMDDFIYAEPQPAE